MTDDPFTVRYGYQYLKLEDYLPMGSKGSQTMAITEEEKWGLKEALNEALANSYDETKARVVAQKDAEYQKQIADRELYDIFPSLNSALGASLNDINTLKKQWAQGKALEWVQGKALEDAKIVAKQTMPFSMEEMEAAMDDIVVMNDRKSHG